MNNLHVCGPECRTDLGKGLVLEHWPLLAVDPGAPLVSPPATNATEVAPRKTLRCPPECREYIPIYPGDTDESVAKRLHEHMRTHAVPAATPASNVAQGETKEQAVERFLGERRAERRGHTEHECGPDTCRGWSLGPETAAAHPLEPYPPDAPSTFFVNLAKLAADESRTFAGEGEPYQIPIVPLTDVELARMGNTANSLRAFASPTAEAIANDVDRLLAEVARLRTKYEPKPGTLRIPCDGK